MRDLEEEMFHLIRSVVFAGAHDEAVYYEGEIGEAARLIAGFVEENYVMKHTCDKLCSMYGCPNDPDWKGDLK